MSQSREMWERSEREKARLEELNKCPRCKSGNTRYRKNTGKNAKYRFTVKCEDCGLRYNQ